MGILYFMAYSLASAVLISMQANEIEHGSEHGSLYDGSVV
jgi:hypothetical protein